MSMGNLHESVQKLLLTAVKSPHAMGNICCTMTLQSVKNHQTRLSSQKEFQRTSSEDPISSTLESSCRIKEALETAAESRAPGSTA